ncbi:Chromosome segregation protein SMC [Candidatus Ornithobacterium hominis]|uniref:zinc ribbon domain-containing protein n=1 Tax=Candidatus Ornithobacterium hominis TaxID=2497989 RepID=UPI0024BBF73F|nr:hypothetical protein [Candidatus Ornithobacterium hominis]CAI9430068.1 Chromosome segregation protein SMC [Candidatus Ornithobacterium hominis]
MSDKNLEPTVEEKLRSLYNLQLIDSRLDQIRNTRGELPLEVQDLDDEIAGMGARVEKIEKEIDDLNKDIKEKKEAIKTSEALMEKYTKQQDNVRNNREFEALSKEVEYQELEIKLSEKRIKEAKAKIEHKKESLAELNEKIESYTSHLEHKKQELEDIVKDTEKEEQKLTELAEKYGKEIEPKLLKAYKKIRNSVKNGLAVVPVERGASAGSFFTIPPQRQMEIAMRKKIILDEHSGRILVDSELADEQREIMKKNLKA